MNTCIFIGHYALPYGDERKKLQKQTSAKIAKLYARGCNVFLTSAAFFGFNMLAAYEVITLKEKGLPIKLKIAHPFKDYEVDMGDYAKQSIKEILRKADEIVYVPQGNYPQHLYAVEKYFIKNSSHAILYEQYHDAGVVRLVEKAKENGVKIT